MLNRILPLGLMLCLAAPVASSQQGKMAPQQGGEGIQWAKTFEAAAMEASIRNVPIMFAAHKDG